MRSLRSNQLISRHTQYIPHCRLLDRPPPRYRSSPMGRQTAEPCRCLLRRHSYLAVPLVVRHWPPHLAPPTLIIRHTQQPCLLASRLPLALLRRADLFENSTCNRLVHSLRKFCDCSVYLPFEKCATNLSACANTICERAVFEYSYLITVANCSKFPENVLVAVCN